VASFGNPAVGTSTLPTAASAVIRRRSAVVDRLRQRIELFRDRSSTSVLHPSVSLSSTSSSVPRRRDDLLHHHHHQHQQHHHPYLVGSRQQELTHRSFVVDQESTVDELQRQTTITTATAMMTDGGCWTAIAAPADAATTMVDPGVGGRWMSRGNGPRTTSAPALPGVDVRQWQSTEVSSSVTSSRVSSSCLRVSLYSALLE
jgi:MamL-1 domain